MAGFWQRIVNGKHDNIAYKLYKILLPVHQRDLFYSKWSLSIKDSFISSDVLWTSQATVPIPKTVVQMVKLKLIEHSNMYAVIQFLLLLNA